MEAATSISPLKYTLLFALMVLVQVVICDNILLFGVAVPFVLIYFIIALPLDAGPKLVMTSAFLLGLLVDIFTDTMGLNSLSCLLLAVLKKPVFYAYMPREDKYVNVVPCITTMGWFNYLKFALTLAAIYSALVFSIELFSFASFGRIIVMISSSTLLTLCLLLAIDSIFYRSRTET